MTNWIMDVHRDAPRDYPDGYETEDSGYASYDEVSLLTRSVHSSIYEYRFEHGRRYHAFKEGENDYFAPNDEPEQFRMDMQHRCMFMASGSKIFHSPIASPERILDLGTGTGIWAIEVAENYSLAEVTGVDLSPIQPDWAPDNVKFEVDDVEDDWTWPENHFDLIYSKTMLVGAIANYRKYFEQAYKHCKPNGYFECLEMTTNLRSDHTKILDSNPIHRWTILLKEGIRGMGRNLDVDFDHMASLMRDVGFVDVTLKPFKVPIGTWPADPVLKKAGTVQLVAMLEGIEGLSLAVFTRCLGWTPEATQQLLEEARKEFRRKNTCYYWPGVIVYGRKPVSS